MRDFNIKSRTLKVFHIPFGLSNRHNFLMFCFIVVWQNGIMVLKYFVFLHYFKYADREEKLNLENAQLKRQRASLENDLLKTQVSQKMYH